LEFGIDVRGPKCLNDGAIPDGRKSFKIGSVVSDTIPAVTDSQPATQPVYQTDTLL